MLVEIEQELYEKVRNYVDLDRVEYPSIKNFVEKAVKDKLRIELINKKEQE